MEMVSVVDIVEGNGGCGEDVKVGWVGGSEGVSGVEGIYENRGSSDDFISEAVEYLVSGRVLKVSTRGSIIMVLVMRGVVAI